jgi:hypothetical protein
MIIYYACGKSVVGEKCLPKPICGRTRILTDSARKKTGKKFWWIMIKGHQHDRWMTEGDVESSNSCWSVNISAIVYVVRKLEHVLLIMKQRKYMYILIFNAKKTSKLLPKSTTLYLLYNIWHYILTLNVNKNTFNTIIPFSKCLTKCMHIVDLQIAHF